MWVLTEALNEYDQYGEYFIAVWKEKPTVQQLQKIVGMTEEYIEEFILGGKGRKDSEHVWYYLTEMMDGEKYESYN